MAELTERDRRSLTIATALLGALLLAGCTDFNRGLDRGLESLFALLLLVFGALALGYVALLWVTIAMLVRRLRGQVPWDMAPVGTACGLVVLHGNLIRFFPPGTGALHFGDTLAWTSGLPVLLLAISASGVAVRSPRLRLGMWACSVVVAAFAALAVQRYARPEPKPPQRKELPAPVVQAASAFGHACARLANGQVACSGVNWGGQLGTGDDRNEREVTLVKGLDDATSVAVAFDVGCALRRRGDAVCWGGGKKLGPPSDPFNLWKVPESDGAERLVVLETKVAGVRKDGTTFGWPGPLPSAWGRVDLLVANSNGWGMCAKREAKPIECVNVHYEGRIESRYEVAGTESTVAIALDNGGHGCYVLASGRFGCFDKNGEPRAAPDINDAYEVIVGAQGDEWYCAHRRAGAVLCWHPHLWEPPKPTVVLETKETITAAVGDFCTFDAMHRLSCLDLGPAPDGHLRTILEWDRQAASP